MLPLCVKVAAPPLLSFSVYCHCTLPSLLYIHTSFKSAVSHAHLMCLLEGIGFFFFCHKVSKMLINELEKSSLTCLQSFSKYVTTFLSCHHLESKPHSSICCQTLVLTLLLQVTLWQLMSLRISCSCLHPLAQSSLCIHKIIMTPCEEGSRFSKHCIYSRCV